MANNVWNNPRTSKLAPGVNVIFTCGARCSSMVRAFTNGAKGRGIDPSRCTHRAISHFSQCCTTVLSCLWDDAYKRTIAAYQIE